MQSSILVKVAILCVTSLFDTRGLSFLTGGAEVHLIHTRWQPCTLTLTSDSNSPTTYNTWQRFTKARHGETGIHEMKKKKTRKKVYDGQMYMDFS